MADLAILNAYEDDGGGHIVLVEQQPDGTAKERRVRAVRATYHRAADIEPPMMRSLKEHSRTAHVEREGEWIRVGWLTEEDRRKGRWQFRELGIDVFEGDVDPVMHHLVTTNAKIAKPRRCYLDLETDSRVPLNRKADMRILSWAVVDGETGEEHSAVLASDDVKAETELLAALVELLDAYDQIVVWEGNWDGGEFDSVVLPARLERCGLPDARRWIFLNQLDVWEKMNQAESGAEAETLKLEDIAFEQLGEGKERTPDFVFERFGARAKKGLGALAWDLWEAGGEFRELLRFYNVRDAKLLFLLEERKRFIRLFQAICEICGIIPEGRSLATARHMDGFLLRLCRERNMRGPTKFFSNGPRQKFQGAYVMEARSTDPEWRAARGMTTGILENVHVCDFSGMYPSIIVSWNLSYETKCPPDVRAEYLRTKTLPPNVALSPTTGVLAYTDRPGILPDALIRLIDWRKEFADLAASLTPGTPEANDAQAKSNAAKVTTNAFYGGSGSPDLRWFDREVAESTSTNGAVLIQKVIEAAEIREMDPVGGDTDSAFVMGPTRKGFGNFVAWCNAELLPGVLRAHGCRENRVKLAFEKTFARLVVLKKKNYVGTYSHYKGTPASATSRPEIKGLAYKRGDRGKLARELQAKVIDLLVGGGLTQRLDDGKTLPVNEGLKIYVEGNGEARLAHEDEQGEVVDRPTADQRVFEALVRASRDHVLLEDLPIEEVRISKSLSQNLRDYGPAPKDAHVKIATILAERGQAMSEGVRVEYVVVDGGVSPQIVIPAEDYAGECDRYHLWEHVFKPTKSLLEAALPALGWDDWLDVRPVRQRKKDRAPEGQLGFRLETSNPDDDEAALGVATFSHKPLVVRIPNGTDEATLARVNEALRSHPGPRAIEIVVETPRGEGVLRSELRVQSGPRLKAALAEALSPPAAAP